MPQKPPLPRTKIFFKKMQVFSKLSYSHWGVLSSRNFIVNENEANVLSPIENALLLAPVKSIQSPFFSDTDLAIWPESHSESKQ